MCICVDPIRCKAINSSSVIALPGTSSGFGTDAEASLLCIAAILALDASGADHGGEQRGKLK